MPTFVRLAAPPEGDLLELRRFMVNTEEGRAVVVVYRGGYAKTILPGGGEFWEQRVEK
jgi:hypothetical protein